MGKRQNLIGEKFGRLEVISEAGRSKQGRRLWKCKCTCGNETILNTNVLISGTTKSCGCLRNEVARERMTTHGISNSRLFSIWSAMKKRCYNKNFFQYNHYGGRGITICPEWLHNFQAFYDWAMANGYRDDLTIERKNNDKGYSPDNCRWATNKEQQNNKRTNRILTLNGETHTVSEWGEITGLNRRLIEDRITRLGWSDEKALTTPKRNMTKRRKV
mgnify:CR=1 FL=1